MPPKARKTYVKGFIDRIGPKILRAIQQPIIQAVAVPLIGVGAALLWNAKAAAIDEPLDKLFDRFGVPKDEDIREGLERYVLEEEQKQAPPGFQFQRYADLDAPIPRGEPAHKQSAVVSPGMIEYFRDKPQFSRPSALERAIRDYRKQGEGVKLPTRPNSAAGRVNLSRIEGSDLGNLNQEKTAPSKKPRKVYSL